MKSRHLSLILVCGFVAFASPAFASSVLNHVDGSMTALASAGPYGATKNYSETFGDLKDTEDRTDPATFEHSLSGTAAGTFSAYDAPTSQKYTYDATALVNDHIFASAQPALLRLAADGQMFTTTTPVSGDPSLGRAASTADAITLRASWDDTILFNKPGLPVDKAYTVNAKLLLSGGFNATLGTTSYAKFSLEISGTGVPQPPAIGAYWAYFEKRGYDHSEDFDIKAPKSVPISFLVYNRLDSDIAFHMQIDGSTLVVGDSNLNYLADFSHTLAWGGIDSVTDYQTGETVDGWMVTSASGADYSQPVPEPSSLTLLTLGVLGIAATIMCRQRNRRFA